MGDESRAKPLGPGETREPPIAPTPETATPTPDVPPFGAADHDDGAWETELAAWDAAIPVVDPGAVAPSRPIQSGAFPVSGPGTTAPDFVSGAVATGTVPVAVAVPSLDDLPDLISGPAPAGDAETPGSPGSGPYAALAATDESVPTLFDSEPPIESAPAFPDELLTEMAAAPWTEDIGRLVLLGTASNPPAPEAAYFETLGKLVDEERALETDRERIVDLLLGGARIAELLGNLDRAWALVDAALGADLTSLGSPAAVAAHRARLGLAERLGRSDDEAAAESLARLSLIPHPDHGYYRTLQAEWTLTRAARGEVDAIAAARIAGAPEGLARLLAEAEMAWPEAAVAAAMLESAADRVGGNLGAALLVLAASLNERAGDVQSAAGQRAAAHRMDDERRPAAVGMIRDAARLDAADESVALENLLGLFPPTPLKAALARRAAACAREAGDVVRAWTLLADGDALGPVSAGLVRDRLDARAPVIAAHGAGAAAGAGGATSAGSGTIDRDLDAVARHWPTPIAGVCLALRACELGAHPDALVLALARAERALTDAPPTGPLGPALEALASRTGADRGSRLRALRLWRLTDAARGVTALLELADTLLSGAGLGGGQGPSGDPMAGTGLTPGPSPHLPPASADKSARDSADKSARDFADKSARAVADDRARDAASVDLVLDEIAKLDPASTAFWRHAALATNRGQSTAAAGRIDRGVDRTPWRESPFAGPLREIAAELVARRDSAIAAARFVALDSDHDVDPNGAPGDRGLGARLTGERIFRAAGDRARFGHATRATPGAADDPERRAAALLEPVFWSGGGAGRSVVDNDASDRERERDERVAAALDLVPLHPIALGVALGAKPDLSTLSDRFWAGAEGGDGRPWAIAASVAAAVAGDAPRALAFALETRAVAARGGRADRGFDGDASYAQNASNASNASTIAGEGTGDNHVRDSATDEPVAALVRRFVWAASDAETRTRVLSTLAGPASPPARRIEAAEAYEELADGAGAARLYESAAALSVADEQARALDADARVGVGRLVGELPWRRADAYEAVPPVDRLGPLEAAVRGHAWSDVVSCLKDAPPHEESASPDILALAALVDAGRADGTRARALEAQACGLLVAHAARTTIPGGESDYSADADTSIGNVTRSLAGTDAELGVLLRAADAEDPASVEVAGALERLGDASASAGDTRSGALLLLEAASSAVALAAGDPTSATDAERRLRAAIAHDSLSAPALIEWRRFLTRTGRFDEAAEVSVAEAAALIDPELRVQALLRAAGLLVRPPAGVPRADGVLPPTDRDRAARAIEILRRALEIVPTDQLAFIRLRDLYETSGAHSTLAELLAHRIVVTTNPFEVTALRLARAEVFAGPLGDRARAKAELEAILQKEPQHGRALGRLADFEEDDGHHAVAADLLVRRAFGERSPEKLREVFLRLGRIYTKRTPDPKRAVGAYSRVLQLDANNREALDELSLLYLGLGESKSAVAITERLVRLEPLAARRARYHVRLGQLADRGGDGRTATTHFKRAVEDAPGDVEALGELVRFLDKSRDPAARRMVLDRAASELRAAIVADPARRSTWEAFAAVSRWRGRAVVGAAAGEVVASPAAGRPEKAGPPTTWVAPAGVGPRLAALIKPAADDKTFPASVPPSVRQLFRLVGPLLAEGRRPDPARHGVDRNDRVAPAQPPREIWESVARDLGAGPFELYVSAIRLGGRHLPLAVEPGKLPAIVVDAALVKLGPHAARFMAARTLRLVSTHLDQALAGPPAELAAWVGAVIRQFVAEYRHPAVDADALTSRAGRVAKLLSKKLRQEIMPFALESSGDLDFAAVLTGIRDGADRVGLVASGSLGAALSVVLIANGWSPNSTPWVDALARDPEASALLTFALSDDYDDLVRAME